MAAPALGVSQQKMTTFRDRCSQELISYGVKFEEDDACGAFVVPALCQEVGDLVITFDDCEITVFIERITHSHFTLGACGDIHATDKSGETVREAVEFVTGVLNDKWIIWQYPNGAGGCYPLGREGDPMVDAPLGNEARCFLWSGPFSHGLD